MLYIMSNYIDLKLTEIKLQYQNLTILQHLVMHHFHTINDLQLFHNIGTLYELDSSHSKLNTQTFQVEPNHANEFEMASLCLAKRQQNPNGTNMDALLTLSGSSSMNLSPLQVQLQPTHTKIQSPVYSTTNGNFDTNTNIMLAIGHPNGLNLGSTPTLSSHTGTNINCNNHCLVGSNNINIGDGKGITMHMGNNCNSTNTNCEIDNRGLSIIHDQNCNSNSNLNSNGNSKVLSANNRECNYKYNYNGYYGSNNSNSGSSSGSDSSSNCNMSNPTVVTVATVIDHDIDPSIYSGYQAHNYNVTPQVLKIIDKAVLGTTSNSNSGSTCQIVIINGDNNINRNHNYSYNHNLDHMRGDFQFKVPVCHDHGGGVNININQDEKSCAAIIVCEPLISNSHSNSIVGQHDTNLQSPVMSKDNTTGYRLFDCQNTGMDSAHLLYVLRILLKLKLKWSCKPLFKHLKIFVFNLFFF